jgi:hypothetical protein
VICGRAVIVVAIQPSTGLLSRIAARHSASSTTRCSFLANSRVDRFSYSRWADPPATSTAAATVTGNAVVVCGLAVPAVLAGSDLATNGWQSTHLVTRSAWYQ